METIKRKTNYLLYGLASLLMVMPGLIVTEARESWMIPMSVGLVVLIVALVRSEIGDPSTALALLLVLNISYWLSHAVWMARNKVWTITPIVGIDPFSGPLVAWVVLLVGSAFYLLVVFTRGLFTAGKKRLISSLGMVGLLIHVSVTFAIIWNMLQGV